MKRYIYFTVLGIMTIAANPFYSCDIGYDCVFKDELPDFDSLNYVEDMFVESIFFEPRNVFEEGELEFGDVFIIEEDSIYNSWKDLGGCLECNFPEIDFSTRTLIGRYQQLPCGFFPSVRIEKEGNTYKHTLKGTNYNQCGSASCDNFAFGWVTVPKIDAAATVEFDFGIAYYECECD
jgi:hypothetical protein